MASLDEDEAAGRMSHEDAVAWVRTYQFAAARANVTEAAEKANAAAAAEAARRTSDMIDYKALNDVRHEPVPGTKDHVIRAMRNYQPVSNTFPALKEEWRARVAARGLSFPWSDAELNRVLEKAERYVLDRTSNSTTIPMVQYHTYTFAMCMVMLHEWRGFPLRHLEEALVTPLLARDKTAREYVREHPRFNPFELMMRGNQGLFEMHGQDVYWPSAYTMDMDRVAVAIAENFENVVVRYWTHTNTVPRDEDAYIVAVEPGCYTVQVFRAGRVIRLWWTLHNRWEGQSGEHRASLSWEHSENSQTVRDIERTLVGKPVRMRTSVRQLTGKGKRRMEVDEDHNFS